MFVRRGLVAYTSARRSMQLIARPTGFTMMATQRLFANINSIESGSGKLIRALDKEIKYENDNYT
jgi:hypothetical protein